MIPLRLLGLINILFPLILGAGGMYVVEEARFRDLGGGVAAMAEPPASAAEAAARQDFAQVLDFLNAQSYYRPLDTAELWYGAAAGLAKASGDQYTTFISPTANKLFEQDLEGQVEGIGAFITTSTGEPTILEPLPGSPAERAGLRRHDKLKQINGYETTGLTANDIGLRTRGAAGTTVRLTLQRGTDTPFDVDIVRAHVEVPACRTTIPPDRIAVIRCWLFDDKTMADFDDGLRQAVAADAVGLILDLRSNSGGFTLGAQQMIGRFVSPSVGPAYYRAHYKGDFSPEPVPILAPPADAPTWFDKPVVLIANGDTASASEIVAAALQDYGRVKIVGTHTNGKGSEQYYYKLDDGSGVFVTYVHWLTPKLQDINRTPYVAPDPNVTPTPLPTFTPVPLAGVPTLPPALLALHTHYGVLPDFPILSTPDDDKNDRDPEMVRAVAYLLTGK
jgi:carboxyl-terminal processing protease